jgi:hypothetical protein
MWAAADASAHSQHPVMEWMLLLAGDAALVGPNLYEFVAGE